MKVCFVLKKKLVYWFEGFDRPIPQVDDIFVWKGEAYAIRRRVFYYPENESRLLIEQE